MTGDTGLSIGMLGPLQGARDGEAIAMPRGRPAVLLAALAMSPGHPVSGTRLAELIWDDDERPDRARVRLQTVVARLRRLLPGVVVTTGDGYLLDVDPAQVDLCRFRDLVRAAGRAPGPTALSKLDEAAGLWRGVALDVMPEPDAITLLHTAAGPGRVAADDPAVADIVGLCGRLPLAVRIAAALLRNRPTWSPPHLAARLRAVHTRLAALAGPDQDRDRPPCSTCPPRTFILTCGGCTAISD
ncbi:MAG TPA: hypothetical protein VG268_09705 [Streptosporangiaceae bacterium]|nr:hypothetical protein [Streptosporangiaceae bacterium]